MAKLLCFPLGSHLIVRVKKNSDEIAKPEKTVNQRKMKTKYIQPTDKMINIRVKFKKIESVNVAEGKLVRRRFVV